MAFPMEIDGLDTRQESAAEGIYITASACIGMVWPPFAAPGENVCQRSLNRTSEQDSQHNMHLWRI